MSVAAPLDVIGDLQAWAVEYAGQGLEIFPVDAKTKQPMAAHVRGAPSQYGATADPEVVAGWWDRWPDALIGHRLPEDQIVIDIDPRHGGDKTWKLLREELGLPYPDTRLHVSGREDGGGHAWFLRPAGKLTISRLDDWAEQRGVGHKIDGADRWVCGLDLLHRMHRYTILPPSPHPVTGMPYRWHQWRDVAPMPVELAELLSDTSPPPPPYEPKPYEGDSIADWYSAKHGVAELLHRHGWHLRSVGSGDADGARWQHPTATSPISATVRHGCLFVYSPNTPFEVTAPGDAHGYTPFRVFTTLEHGGDASAAARAARELKDGPRERTTPQVSDFNPPPPLHVDPETGEIADDGPVPLDVGTSDLPAFPLHVLPDWMADEARAAADAIQVPVEITAFLALMTLSIAVAGKIEVEAFNWRQPLNLYGTVVAPTGTGKSPAAERMLAPLLELEQGMVEATSAAVAYSEAEATSHANAVADAEKALKNDPGATSLIAQLADARQTANEHRVLAPYRMTVDDHTPEALAQTIASQVDERIAVVSPEGAALFESMTGKRYRDASAAANVPDVYLKSWSGEQISVDRVGRAALIIRRPVLTVCVMVQPDIIHSLSMTPSVARQGGLARFLWVVAADIVGTRDRKRRRHAPPPSADYRAGMLRIGTWAANAEPASIVYTTSEAAADIIDDLANEREARMGFGGDLEAHRAIEAKILAYHWRLSALLAVAHGDRDTVSPERAHQATELVDYFMAHAVAVHAAAGLEDGGSDTWRRMARWMIDHAGQTVEPRQIWTSMRAVYRHTADIVPDLERLMAMRWVAVEGDLSAIGVKGQPNPTLTIHPEVARAATRNLAQPRANNYGAEG